MELDGFSLTESQWCEKMSQWGEQPFRGRQIFGWLHKKLASSYDEMTNLPAALRDSLNSKIRLAPLRVSLTQHSANDGTQKFLLSLWDKEQIEAVLMKYRYGYSLCISSQVGCRMGCRFCASTLSGKKRDLSAGEMAQQIYAVERQAQVRVSHVVVMGCGEPFDNYDALMQFLRLIHDPAGHGMSMRNITVSTCGLTKPLREFADEGLGVTLAVSLHAPNDTVRKQLMPVADAVSMDELLEACGEYTQKTHRRITFEYALARGMNDQPAHARELADRLAGLLCHVNLIPINPVRERGLQPSEKGSVEAFREILEQRHIPVTVRREMGGDIDAACGQLRRRYEEQEETDGSSGEV